MELRDHGIMGSWDHGNVGSWDRGIMGSFDRGMIGSQGHGIIGSWECEIMRSREHRTMWSVVNGSPLFDKVQYNTCTKIQYSTVYKGGGGNEEMFQIN